MYFFMIAISLLTFSFCKSTSLFFCKFFKISLCPQWVQRFRRLFVLENFTAFAGLRRLCNALK